MKFKKILLASIFLLAILTIGAASASENLTDSDVINAADKVILDSTDSSAVLNDGSYFDDDFYIYVEENFTHGKRDWNAYEMIYISSYSEKNSTIDILVDDIQKKSINVTEGIFSIEKDVNGTEYKLRSTFIYPNDLGMTLGSHNIKVNVNGNTRIDTSVSMNQKEDFTIWLLNPYYSEQQYWPTSSFLIIDSNSLNTGTLEVYVNGTRKLNYPVSNGYFEEIEDCSNKSRYVAASDILEGYGTYNIQIKFTENGTTKTLRDENVVVAEFEPTVNPKVEVYFDFYTLIIPADNIAHIYLPREATGKLTISYNNIRNKTVEYSKGRGQFYMNNWDLNHLGENQITVTYTGDDFGTLTTTETVTVLPKITCPSYVNVGEQFNISLLTHGWVNGNLNIYEYNGDVKGKFLASAEINAYSAGDFAAVSVPISGLKAGWNKLYLDYNDYYAGHYPIIQEVYVVQNSEKVSVDVPGEVEVESSFNVTVTAPAVDFTFAQISVDDGGIDFIMIQDGKATKNVSNLTAGCHSIRVFYENQYFEDGKWVGDVYLNTFTVNVGVKTNLNADDVVTDYNSAANLIVTLKDANNNILTERDIKIDLNGKNYIKTTDGKGQATLPVNLPVGNYTAFISFEGSSGYLSSNTTSKITVNKVKTKLEASDLNAAYGGSKLDITLKDAGGVGVANKNVLVSINGVNYTGTTNANGKASVSVNPDAGNYVAKISFAGDDSYIASDVESKVIINKVNTKLTAPSISTVYNVGKNLIITLEDANGHILAGKNVAVTFNGKTYDKTTDSNGQVKISSYNLAPKSYAVAVKFDGDNNYLESGINSKVVINKATPKITASNKAYKVKTKTKQYTITLKNNKNAVMKNKKVTLKVKGKTYTAKTNSKGKATFKITKLTKKGTYKAVIKYSGDSYYKSASKTTKITVKK